MTEPQCGDPEKPGPCCSGGCKKGHSRASFADSNFKKRACQIDDSGIINCDVFYEENG